MNILPPLGRQFTIKRRPTSTYAGVVRYFTARSELEKWSDNEELMI